MKTWLWLTPSIAFSIALSAPTFAAPQLSGTYDVGTLTPLERPEAFGDNLHIDEATAGKMSAGFLAAKARDAQNSDPNRAAPPKAKSPGGYNLFWINPGEGATEIDGKFRTSIITTPSNGRRPAMTAFGNDRMQSLFDAWTIVWRNPDPTTTKDASSAWWLEDGNPDGPYDHIEQRPLAERCIIGSRSTAGPPMLPNIYNNYKRLIQTEDRVMILTEMNHDARVVRLNSAHPPTDVQFWLGDSIGWFEGETLVVETTNFGPTPPLSGASENLRVLERFSKTPEGDLNYSFTVSDPVVWTADWSGEYAWKKSTGKVYEYACHEGNYAIGNIMRGARLLESQAGR
jgi:hypothetical protein